MDRLSVDEGPSRAGSDVAIRVLEESTVLTDNFVFRVACQPLKGLRNVHDRMVLLPDVA